ncbi:MAG: GAF domain-containing protein [Deltaproteobacteria bacterium]|nr:GAF domain-containing protein [Deltaproteobacteria bacterium]
MADPKKEAPSQGEVRADPQGRTRNKEDFLALFKRGQEFTEELLQDNERMRFQVAGLQEEVAVLRRQLEQNTAVTDLITQIKALEADRQRLLDHYHNVETANRDYSSRYLEIEEAHNNLANLYVASYQLHSTLHFPEVIQIINEILLNLIGAEEFALYLLDEQTGLLQALVSEGRPLAEFAPTKLGEGRMGAAVAQNQQQVGEKGPAGTLDEPVAIIPLCVGERRVGAVVLLKLLVQKPALSALDFEIFSLLGAQAATAILASAQQGGQAAFLVTRGLYEKLWQAPVARPEGA